MVRKLGAIGATVFISSGTEARVALKLTVLLGVFVGALLLQVRVRSPKRRASNRDGSDLPPARGCAPFSPTAADDFPPSQQPRACKA